MLTLCIFEQSMCNIPKNCLYLRVFFIAIDNSNKHIYILCSEIKHVENSALRT